MNEKKSVPRVNADSPMKEFTLRSVLLGLVMAVFMGAANAYLGLKAGMTIAATYATAVIAMAVIKALKGTILEENCARTIGSIGGNIASGAIFTLPAFFIAGIWQPFFSTANYISSTIILVVGGILGIMFVTITRRVLINNADLPFPESVAAAEIHKAGQKGAGGSRALLLGMGVGIFFKLLTEFKVIALKWQKVVSLGKGSILLRGPEMSPAFLGVGYIIGPKLAGINFSGGVLAWGLLAPVIAFFLNYQDVGAVGSWAEEISLAWKNYVRHIAIGGMLISAFYTLFKMRKSLAQGIVRSFSTLKQRQGPVELPRTDRDLNIKWTMITMGLISVLIFFIFNGFAKNPGAALVAAVLMLILGFVFAAVSGYLVGIIGVSSNPTSGLTVSVLIIVAFVMVMMGLSGTTGIAAVLGMAAFTCVSVSVAGEMMQDLKAGHILGCTPWRMQIGDMFGVTIAALVMFFVLSILHLGNIKQTVSAKLTEMEQNNISTVSYVGNYPKIEARNYSLAEIKGMAPEIQNEILATNAGFGGETIPAPQASLMAVVAKGIIQKKTEWILIVAGMFMGFAFILMQVKSPMLISVGMYLPIDTSFAIFLGGVFKSILEHVIEKRKLLQGEKDAVNNTGTLLASGLISGEALIGILFAALAFAEIKLFTAFGKPTYLLSLAGIIALGAFLIIATLGGQKDRRT